MDSRPRHATFSAGTVLRCPACLPGPACPLSAASAPVAVAPRRARGPARRAPAWLLRAGRRAAAAGAPLFRRWCCAPAFPECNARLLPPLAPLACGAAAAARARVGRRPSAARSYKLRSGLWTKSLPRDCPPAVTQRARPARRGAQPLPAVAPADSWRTAGCDPLQRRLRHCARLRPQAARLLFQPDATHAPLPAR